MGCAHSTATNNAQVNADGSSDPAMPIARAIGYDRIERRERQLKHMSTHKTLRNVFQEMDLDQDGRVHFDEVRLRF